MLLPFQCFAFCNCFCLSPGKKISRDRVNRINGDHYLVGTSFCGELSRGKWSIDGQKKRFKDGMKVTLKDIIISMEAWESLAAYCLVAQPCCCRSPHKGAAIPPSSRAETSGFTVVVKVTCLESWVIKICVYKGILILRERQIVWYTM